MLIGRIRFFVDNLRWLSILLINTLLSELLQLNVEFNLYSWIERRARHSLDTKYIRGVSLGSLEGSDKVYDKCNQDKLKRETFRVTNTYPRTEIES